MGSRFFSPLRPRSPAFAARSSRHSRERTFARPRARRVKITTCRNMRPGTGTGALDAVGQTGDAALLAKLAALGFRVRRYGACAALDDDTGQGRAPPMPLLYDFAERQGDFGALLRALQAPNRLRVEQ